MLWFGREILALIRVSLPPVPSFVMIGNLGHVHGPPHLADELTLILDGPLSVKAVTGIESRSRVLCSEH